MLLIGCAGASEIQDLQNLVDGNHFKYQWQENVFECSDMSVANQAFLVSHGYEAKIAIVAYDGDPNYLHCITLACRLTTPWRKNTLTRFPPSPEPPPATRESRACSLRSRS